MTELKNETTVKEEEQKAIPVFCKACGDTTHIEIIGTMQYYVCDDITCQWMQPV